MFGTYQRLGLPVWASSREVIAATRRKFTPEARRNPAFSDARKSVYRQMLAYHNRAARLYRMAAR